MFKRIVSFLLALVLLTGMIPVPAHATQPDAALDTGNVTVEGTNGFGHLLSEEVADHQASIEVMEEAYTDGYTVTDLEITGNTAKVTYDSLEEATLVVAIYTENGRTLLCSGHAPAMPDQTQATVTLSGTMPEYFYASAYLVDNYDLSPLCPAYDTPMYTKEMQDLLASTVDDYEEDRVLNLDSDKSTNFAVYAETTKVIEYMDGVNTILSANDETCTYVIGSADEQITSLAPGDVVVYVYGENEMLILKVDSIAVEDDTATITGAELQMEEVFSYVKIEGTGDTGDAQVDENAPIGEGLTYLGVTKEDPSSPSFFGEEGEFSTEFAFSYALFHKGADDGPGFSIDGSLKFSVSTELKYMAGPTRQFIELRVKTSLGFEGEFKGTAPSLNFPLVPAMIPVIPSVSIGIEPEFVVEFEASIKLEIGVSGCVGMSYESGKGFQNLSEAPKFNKPDISAEGKLFIGVNLKPTVEVAAGALVDLSLTATIGGEITAEMTGTAFEEDLDEARAEFTKDELHACKFCVDGNISAKIELGAEIKFLNIDKLTFQRKFGEAKFPIGKFYYSVTNKKFGWKECPYKDFRVIFSVRNAINQAIPDIPVSILNGKLLGTTDKLGTTAAYLPAGDYTFQADVPNKNVTQKVKLTEACKVQLTAERTEINLGGALGSLSSENYKDYGSTLAYGAEGGVRWYLHHNGMLRILGEGALSSELATKIRPYKNYVTDLIISSGITGIPTSAFADFTRLETAKIPDTVTNWGSWAFQGCTALTEVTVPVDYNPGTFRNCNQVKKITYTPGVSGKMPSRVNYAGHDASIQNQMEYTSTETLHTVVFEEGITSIGAYALAYVDALTEVTIPSTLESIGDYAFADCDALPTIHLPEGLTYLGSCAFQNCVSLDDITIPTSLTAIHSYTFGGCTSLSEILLPESIVSVGTQAFQNCTGLKKAVISDNVESWGSYAFQNCTALEAVTVPVDYSLATFRNCNQVKKITYTPGVSGKMPSRVNYSGYDASIQNQMEYASTETLHTVVFEEGVTSIGAYALAYVDALTSVTVPSTLESIGDYAFADCDLLPTIHLPEGLTYLGSCAFQNCVSLDDITIPTSLTAIHSYTFGGCTSLSEILLPESIVSVGTQAFQNCTGLKKAVISDNVESWGSYAFQNCTALEEVTVPVDYSLATFRNCNHVEKITYTPGVSGKMPDRVNYSGYDASIQNQMEYASTETLHTVTFAEGVTSIGAYALAYVDALTEVTIPSTLKSIGDYAFADCDALPTLHLPEGLIYLGSCAFQNCVSLDDITIPTSLTTIHTYTFSGCTSLSEILLPESIVSVGTQAFQNCTGLKKAVISDNVESWGSYAFQNCTALEEVTVPVDYSLATFRNCNQVKKITYTPGVSGKMPSRVNYAGHDASIQNQMEYASTETLHTVVFEEGVTSIGAYALAYVDALTSVTVPSTLESIGEKAFYGVTADVYYPAHADTWNESLMLDYGGTLTWIPQEVSGSSAILPEETLPEETVPEETVPEETVQEETVPEETIPAETAPQETLPAETLPEETAPAQTEPETTEAPETMPAETAEETLSQIEPLTLAVLPKFAAAHLLRARSGAAVRTLSAGEEVVQNSAVTEPLCADEDPVCTATEPVFADDAQDLNASIPSDNAIFDGEYESAQYEEYILKTASFKGLTPGAEYLLLAVLDLNASDPIALDNLVHIDQGTASSSGTLSFQYVERQETAYSYVMACGASNKNLKNAKITLDPLYANGTLQVIDPTVTYGGQQLTEGKDYILAGSVAFIDGGEYTCHIRGIYDYTGLLKCTYFVEISDIVAAGTWGSLTWQFLEDGSLVLSGSSENLPNIAETGCPWQDFAAHTTKIVVDDGITALSGNLFPDFAKVTSVSVGKELSLLTGDVFGGCTGLEEFQVSPENTAYCTENGVLYSADKTTLVRYPAGLTEQNFLIPESVTILAPWAFGGSIHLSTVTFPGNAPEAVGENAFFGVKAQINYPRGNRTWTEKVLENAGGSLILAPQTSFASVTAITAETDWVVSGSELLLTARYSPEDQPEPHISWSISDAADIATLENHGTTAILKAGIVQEARTVTIQARTSAFFQEAELQVQILPLAKKVELFIGLHRVTGNTVSFDINEPDRTLKLNAQVLPQDASQQVQWISSNEKIATVSDGLITFTGALGKVTITAAAAEKVKAQVTFQTVAVPHNLQKEFSAETAGGADLSVLGGKSANLRVIDLDTGKFLTKKQITWSLDPAHAAYAAVNSAGKLTTKAVYEKKRLEIIGTMTDNDRITVTYTVDLHPAVSQIELYADEALCGSAAVPFDLTDRDNMVLSAKLYPTGVMDVPVKWTISDRKNAYADYFVDGNEILIQKPTGKTGTVTFKAAAADGSGKNATVKVQFGHFAQSVTITSTETELVSGKGLTLKASIAPETAAKAGIVWSLKNPEDKNYVTLSASGKLTAKTVYGDKEITVIAASKDGQAAPDEHTVTILPKDAGMLLLMLSEDNVTKATIPVDLNTVSQLELTALNYRDGTEEAVTWKSSGAKVASVENGIVTIHKKGSATITATAKDGRKAVVTLKISQLASGVTVADAIVASGKAVTLKANVPDAANAKVDWAIVEGNEFAKITAAGRLTAVKDLASQQTVTVRATAKDGSGKSGEATVTIKPLAQGVQILSGDALLSDTTLEWDMEACATLQLEACVFPFYTGKEAQSAIQAVQWKTSSKAVATVDENGKLTCLKPGKVTITATASDGSGKKTTFKLTVVKRITEMSADTLSVTGGKSLTLSKLVTIAPADATNKKLQWTLVSGGEFATLSATGVLKTKKVTEPQTVDILAKATDGSGKELPITVTILPKA